MDNKKGIYIDNPDGTSFLIRYTLGNDTGHHTIEFFIIGSGSQSFKINTFGPMTINVLDDMIYALLSAKSDVKNKIKDAPSSDSDDSEDLPF